MADNSKLVPVSEKEKNLLKGAFKDNEYLLKAIRSLFFGFDISGKDKKLIKDLFKSEGLKDAIRKKLYPMMDPESPIGQNADYWLGTETQIFGASRDTIHQSLATKIILADMLKNALNLLDNPDGQKIDLSYVPELNSPNIDSILGVKLLARNLYIKTIETGLTFVMLTANQEEKTPEEIKKMGVKNSSK